jgi:hypothetical protein
MIETWREQLQKRIAEIQARGGPSAEGSPIVFDVELSDAAFSAFVLNHRRLNDLPFCGAEAGTLEIDLPMRWVDGEKTTLSFIYRSSPPAEFGSSKGLARAVGPDGEYSRVITGIDFDALP